MIVGAGYFRYGANNCSSTVMAGAQFIVAYNCGLDEASRRVTSYQIPKNLVATINDFEANHSLEMGAAFIKCFPLLQRSMVLSWSTSL